jgi:hypothetical protein
VTSLAFTVPLPPRGQSSNANLGKWHGKWHPKSASRRDYLLECLNDARDALRSADWPVKRQQLKVHVSLVFCLKGVRKEGRYAPRDEPNAVSAFKAGFDALVAADVLCDDSKTWMKLGDVSITSKRGPYVEVLATIIEGETK